MDGEQQKVEKDSSIVEDLDLGSAANLKKKR